MFRANSLLSAVVLLLLAGCEYRPSPGREAPRAAEAGGARAAATAARTPSGAVAPTAPTAAAARPAPTCAVTLAVDGMT